MDYTRLGMTDLEVSRVGLGCCAMGGYDYGEVDDAESTTAIRAALELGINFFDTADVYGFGHSEEVLGRALGHTKHDVVIATKFGVGWTPQGSVYRDTSPGRVVEALEGSLRRLGVDCISLYQIHWLDGVTPIAETMEALLKCREAGKLRHIGCTNFSTAQVAEAMEVGRVESLQCEYSLLRSEQEDDFSQCAEGFQVGTVAYGVLARGLLSGKYGDGVRFGKYDTRSKDERFINVTEKYGNIIDTLRAVGEGYGKSPAQVAINWTLGNDMVVSAIVGAKNRAQVTDNAAAADWRMSDADKDTLDDLRPDNYKEERHVHASKYQAV